MNEVCASVSGSDRLPPLARSGAAHALSSGRCRNCGAAAASRFCPECGQSTTLHPPSVREFLHEFVAHNVALEGSLWRTLHALIVKPGLLTVEYFAGRRARYIAPLRLYLTFSLILFAISSSGTGNLRLGGVLQIGVQPRDGPVTVDVRPAKMAETGFAPLDHALRRISAMPPAEATARITTSARTLLPYVLIALVPVLALYLKILYFNRHRLYGEHLVVAFHAQTAAFAFGSVAGLFPDNDVFDAISSVLVITLVVQGAIALRRVYGGRLVPTLVRTAVLFGTYGLTASLAVATLTVASLLT